ncbi:conjugal transfer protein [Paenibacillus sp. 32O-W]|uniref:conjugal transfer protein n=1 Tax=Paenibacillus sp. 32O-W TaxID=1695218 RepID=UPI0011AA2D56|nr:conjugal transfer protein [Paenibacillus sp. 32O-W]
MDVRLLPKLLLWVMLIVSSLGAISTLLRTEPDPAPAILKKTMEQQMAVHTALSFAREWMRWDGEELPEARMQRLKPYVNPDALARVAALQAEQKTKRQEVIAAEFVSSSASGGSHYAVLVRVIAANPERVVWEVEVPVWAQTGKGAVVAAQPLFRPPQEPPAVPDTGSGEPAASADVKQRMRPAIESFLKAMCEGKDADSLFNYVTTGANLKPLEGRIRFIALERLEVAGTGPYKVTVTFTAQDAATDFRVTQVWKLAVTEENRKFFVGSVE